MIKYSKYFAQTCIRKVDFSRRWPDGSLFNSYYTKVLERALLLSLNCFTLPLFRILWFWVLSKEVSNTIFWVFGMTRPGIEPRFSGLLVNTKLVWPMLWSNSSDLIIMICLHTVMISNSLQGIKRMINMRIRMIIKIRIEVLCFDLRPAPPKMLFQGDAPEGSDTFQWPVIERDHVGGLRLIIWDKVKVPLCQTDWCTGREWALNCMTVIFAWWRLNIQFQRSSGRSCRRWIII